MCKAIPLITLGFTLQLKGMQSAAAIQVPRRWHLHTLTAF